MSAYAPGLTLPHLVADNALGSALGVMSALFRLFTDTGGFVADAVRWLAARLFPAELQTWFLGTIGYAGRDGVPTSVYQEAYRAAEAPALLLAATASSLRLVRGALDHRLPAHQSLVDALPRFMVAVALIGVPGTGIGLGYTVLAWAVNASVGLAAALVATFTHASMLPGLRPGVDWFGGLLQTVTGGGRGLVAAVVGFLPLLIMFLYAVFLMVLRTIMIGFCIATAPLCFATGAFDVQNRFLRFWLDMFVGAMLTPIVMGTSIAISFTLASSVTRALVIGPLLAVVILCGGVWMSGKLTHHLTWRHFAHGGALAGFAAGLATALAPVQRLASVGFLAEALGANRDGGNRAVEVMKRLGIAAQGFHPGGAGPSPALSYRPLAPRTSAGGGRAHLMASGGPPDIAESLGPAGRAAVDGAEDSFNQLAFNAFANQHPALVGALTRDHPQPALSHGDRAKLAWSRVSRRARESFAEDFMSHWLGAEPSTFELGPSESIDAAVSA